MSAPLFRLGRAVATRTALAVLSELNLGAHPFFFRHCHGDYGETCEEDKETNTAALACGDRIVSKYVLSEDYSIFVITEHDRSATTLMLTDEY